MIDRHRRYLRMRPAPRRLIVETAPNTFNLTREACDIIGRGGIDGSGFVRLICLAGRQPNSWVPPQMVATLRAQGHTEISGTMLRRMFYMFLRGIYDAQRPGYGRMLDFVFCPDGGWGQFDNIVAAGSVAAFLAEMPIEGPAS